MSRISHHSHSGQYCHHALDTLEQVLLAAKAHPMSHFALSEHMPRTHAIDLYPEEVALGLTPDDLACTFTAYYADAIRLRRKHASVTFNISIGFEAEWIRPETCAAQVHALQTQYEFDFFIGSVHHVHETPIDFDRITYETARARTHDGSDAALFADYFDAQLAMLNALRPPVVAHFDLVRLYSDDANIDLRALPNVWDRVCRNLRAIAQYGGLLEVNGAALRKGMREPYPARTVCEVFRDLGGVFTVSDDCHAVAQVGLNYARLDRFLNDLGIEQVGFVEQGGKIVMVDVAR